VAIFGCVPFSALFAESALAQQSRSDSSQLEEVVVTAEKRESTVQTTPISLTAVTGTDIQNRGLTDLSDLVLSVPGVSMRTSGPGMAEYEIRGIASTGGNSPTVGFYYDDIPLTAPSATNEGKIVISPNLYDLNRVEVLRGPQGTLYGSGSMGGTIKLVPTLPIPTPSKHRQRRYSPTPITVLRADDVAVRTAANQRRGAPVLAAEIRGAAKLAEAFKGRAQAAAAAIIDGEAGAVWTMRGQIRAVFVFTIERDRIAGIDLVMEPEHLAALDVRPC